MFACLFAGVYICAGCDVCVFTCLFGCVCVIVSVGVHVYSYVVCVLPGCLFVVIVIVLFAVGVF